MNVIYTRRRSGPVLVLLAGVVALGACAGQAQRGAAPAPERKVIRMSLNRVGGYRPTIGNLVLNVEKTIEGSTERYDLFARWTGDARVDVQSGESLIIKADSQEFKFSVLESGIYRDFQCEPRCIYDDRAYFPATAAQIQAIAQARHVTVELIGSKRTVEREFNELNFDRFREFVQKNIPATPAGRPQSAAST